LWFEGQRNDLSMRLSGFLYYLDFTEEEVVSIFAFLMEMEGEFQRNIIQTVRARSKRS
jgi:hypothetical protein